MGTKAAEKHVLISRVINAPRERVFAAWTDAAQLAHWYAPNGCRIEFRTLDARPGGRFHSSIHTPDGHACWCIGEYREVVAPERIVHTMEVSDEHGNALSPIDVGMDPNWPACTVLTVTFAEQEGNTLLTLHQTVDETLAISTGAHPSWLQMLDRLNALLTEK